MKTHSGRSLNVILRETIDTGGRKWRDCYVSPRRCQHQTVWCVCGSFYKAFFSSKRRRKCLPSLSSPGARASCGKCTGPFYECWRTEVVGVAERCFLIRSFRTLRQADYGVLLTRTNCLSVRPEQIVLWVSLAGWWKESTSLKCCPVKLHLSVDCGVMWYLVSFLFDLKYVALVS